MVTPVLYINTIQRQCWSTMDILSGLLRQRFTASARLKLTISHLMSRVAHFDLVPGHIQVQTWCVRIDVVSQLFSTIISRHLRLRAVPELRLRCYVLQYSMTEIKPLTPNTTFLNSISDVKERRLNICVRLKTVCRKHPVGMTVDWKKVLFSNISKPTESDAAYHL